MVAGMTECQVSFSLTSNARCSLTSMRYNSMFHTPLRAINQKHDYFDIQNANHTLSVQTYNSNIVGNYVLSVNLQFNWQVRLLTKSTCTVSSKELVSSVKPIIQKFYLLLSSTILCRVGYSNLQHPSPLPLATHNKFRQNLACCPCYGFKYTTIMLVWKKVCLDYKKRSLSHENMPTILMLCPGQNWELTNLTITIILCTRVQSVV